MASVATDIDAEPTDNQLRLFIERIERLEEEKKGIADDIRDVYAEAKSQGYDAKIMRQIVRRESCRRTTARKWNCCSIPTRQHSASADRKGAARDGNPSGTQGGCRSLRRHLPPLCDRQLGQLRALIRPTRRKWPGGSPLMARRSAG